MSFYLDMLRENDEFMGNIGFDSDKIADPNGEDKYEVELQDIASTIEDINKDYVDQSSQEELDGQDLQEDPVAECMIAIYESDHNWNQIMQAIGQKELLEAAKGREMVMEAVDIKGFFARAKEAFLKMLKKITAIVKNWIDNATAKFRTNTSFAKKYKSTLGKGQEAYNANKGNKKFKGYNFKDATYVGDAQAKKFCSEVDKDNQEAAKEASSLVTKINKNELAMHGVKNANIGRNPDEFRAQLCGLSGTVSADEFRDAIKRAYFGSTEKETLSGGVLNADYLISVLEGTVKDVNDIRKAYASMKRSFNGVLKALKELEKAVSNTQEKGSYTASRSESMTQVTKLIENQKVMKNAASIALATIMKAKFAEAHQARKIANAYIYALNKGTRKDKIDALNGKESVGESAGFFGSLELL